jgi:hypothetical protein
VWRTAISGWLRRAVICVWKKLRSRFSEEMETCACDFLISAVAIGRWKWKLNPVDPFRVIPHTPIR